MKVIKKLIKAILGILSLVIVLVIVLLLYITIRSDDKLINKENQPFNNSDIFDILDYTTINIDKEYENIMVLTDIHLYGIFDDKVFKYIKNMIDEETPDLIVLDGDQCFTPFNGIAYKSLIKFFDSFKIPWAPVFGNHDNFGHATKDKLSRYLVDSEYCLFEYGPSNLNSTGNYLINLSYQGQIVHSLILMDSNDKVGISGNPSVTKEQVDWYIFIINGLKNSINENIKTTLFLHVPIPEFNDAYEYGVSNDTILFGKKDEPTCSPKVNIGFFDKIKDLGSTISIISGHDHLNCFSVDYLGVRFAYALHSGYQTYGDINMMGFLSYKIDKNGSFQSNLVYYKG
jgi:predicted MPP superfamily phosphohydrolase